MATSLCSTSAQRAVAILFTVGFIASAADSAIADPVRCQRAILRASKTFALAKMKTLQRCEEAKIRGKLPPATVCLLEPHTAPAIAKAENRLHAGIAKECGGPDKTCATTLDNDSFASIGWPATCPDFEGSGCTNTIDDCDDLAECVYCIQERAIDQAIALYYDALVPSGFDSALARCQVTIGKATAAFFAAKTKALAKCWDARYTGKHVNACPVPGDGKALAAIQKAEDKKIALIARACSGFTPAEIGFAAHCPMVSVPGGPACGGPIATLEDLIACVDCVTEFKVDCATALSVPAFASYPAECVPVPATPVPTPVPPSFVDVHGAIHADLPTSDGRELPLPDVPVYLHDVVAVSDGPPIATDLDGRYVIPPVATGTYQVCWQGPAWIAGCDPQQHVLVKNTEYVLPIRVQPTSSVIRGRVTLADGSACRFLDPFFSVDQTATVRVFDTSDVPLTASVRATTEGDYVVTGVPAGPVRVRATCDTEEVHVDLTPSASVLSGATAVDLMFANHRARVVSVVARSGSVGVRRAASGATVDVTAEVEDVDTDTLVYTWGTGSGTLGASTTNTVSWTVPTEPGRYSVYFLASDQRGGLERGTLSMIVGGSTVAFSGRVTEADNDGPVPLTGATAQVNGQSTTVNADGGFSLQVPEASRYVLTISRVGYAPVSRIYDTGNAGETFQLVEAQTKNWNPNQTKTLTDTFSVPKPRKGVSVTLAANSVVDGNGMPPTGTLKVALATLDLGTQALPGNATAIDPMDGLVRLVSFGAASIEITDTSGERFNLAPGQTATLRIPVDPDQTLTAPPTIPLWWYDESTGYWMREGTATLVDNAYVATVSHFTWFNMDIGVTTNACIRVYASGSAFGKTLRVSSTAFTQVNLFTVTDPLNLLYALPPNTMIKLELLDASNQPIPNTTQFVDSGNALVNPAPPPYPYTECNAHAFVGLVPPATPTNVFLTRKGGFGANANAESLAYYAAVDPNNLRGNLGAWWAANGFSPTGVGGTRTVYLNDNDLGFGRDMHCLATGADVACYVTNYGAPDQNPANANGAFTQTSPGATVAMEYKAVEGQPPTSRIVKFFVFNGGTASAPRQTFADLDGNGPKYVPQLCTVCHGNNYIPANPLSPTVGELDMKASFREFDLDSFKYPVQSSRAAQEASFKTINLMVKQTNPWIAIKELVDGWYPNNSATQFNAFVPSGWTNTPASVPLYNNIFAKSCRTCHVAQRSNVGGTVTSGSGLEWNQWAQADLRDGQIKSVVCGNKQMPHALVTYRNFWLSSEPHRPDFLAAYQNGAGWLALGTCQ